MFFFVYYWLWDLVQSAAWLFPVPECKHIDLVCARAPAAACYSCILATTKQITCK